MIFKIRIVFFISIMLCLTGCTSGSGVSLDPDRFKESYPSAPDSRTMFGGDLSEQKASRDTYAKADKGILIDDKPADKVGKKGKKGKDSVKAQVFLVDSAKYTTDGAYYQEKYKSSLLSMAERLTTGGMKIAHGSMGFYHDKRTDPSKGLYLGLDMLIENVSGKDYGVRAKSVIFSGLKQIIETIDDYRDIFSEDKIVGTVISFRWKSAGTAEVVNIWILEPEVESYRDDNMTFEEVVHRSCITNGQGRIMLFN